MTGMVRPLLKRHVECSFGMLPKHKSTESKFPMLLWVCKNRGALPIGKNVLGGDERGGLTLEQVCQWKEMLGGSSRKGVTAEDNNDE